MAVCISFLRNSRICLALELARKFYELMNGLPFSPSYLAKILIVSFIGVHIPMIGAVVYVLLSADLSVTDTIDILVALLIATLIGTGLTLAMLFLLLSPVTRAAKALNEYLTDRRVPKLPTRYRDEAGVLLSNVQQAVTRLDLAIDSYRSQRDEALRQHRQKFAVLAGMSHDLRTPLNHVIGYSEMMMVEALGPLGSDRYRGYASDIRASGSDLLETLQAILELSAIEAGEDSDPGQMVELDTAVGEAVGLAHYQADQSGVRIEQVPAGKASQARVPERNLKQILLQLIEALIGQGGEAGPSRLTLASEASGTRTTLVGSSDAPWIDGDIPPELRGDETLPVNSESRSRFSSVTPTGLRLSLIRSLAESVGATVSVDLTDPQGRRVTIAFPAAGTVAS